MQRTLTLQSASSETTVAATLVAVSPSQARRQALKTLAIIWAIGLITVPIPLVHFVSVPVCLLSGPLVAWIVYRMWSKTEEWIGEVACPACSKVSTLKINRHFDDAQRRCSCGETWKIT